MSSLANFGAVREIEQTLLENNPLLGGNSASASSHYPPPVVDYLPTSACPASILFLIKRMQMEIGPGVPVVPVLPYLRGNF